MIKTEAAIQQECLIYFNNNYCLVSHVPRCIMFSVPNEIGGEIAGLLTRLGVSSRIIQQVIGFIMNKMIKIGLTKGVSDTILVLPGKTIYLEFKTGSGYQSPEQVQFQKRIEDLGHEYWLVRSIEQFKLQLMQQAIHNLRNVNK